MPRTDDPFGATDPFRRPDPFAKLDRRLDRALGPAGREPAEFPAASPSALKAAQPGLWDHATSALHYAASALDKPARAVRGALDFNPREALGSLVPFSDSLGITDPKESKSMDQLLQQSGYVGPNDPTKWEARDFIVPALDIAADPLTYANFGKHALTPLGRLAHGQGATNALGHKAMIQGFTHTEDGLRALGKTPAELAFMAKDPGMRIAPSAVVSKARAAGIDDVVGQPLAGLVGFGLPFGKTRATLGHGAGSQAIAGGFDAAWKGANYIPGVSKARQFLDTKAGRSSTPFIQEANELGGDVLRKPIQAEARAAMYRNRSAMAKLMATDPALKGHELAGLHLIGAEAERAGQHLTPAGWAAGFDRRVQNKVVPGAIDPAAVKAHMLANWDAYKAIGSDIRGQGVTWGGQATHHGARHSALDDTMVDYASREHIKAAYGVSDKERRAAKVFETRGPSNLRRAKWLTDVPGGRGMIDALAMDARFSGPARTTLKRAQATQQVLDEFTAHFHDTGQSQLLDTDMMKALGLKAKAVAKELEKVDPIHAASKLPFFDPDILATTLKRGESQGRMIGAAGALAHGAAMRAQPMRPGLIPLDEAGRKIGLKSTYDALPLDAGELAHLATLGHINADEARKVVQAAGRGNPKAVAAAALIAPDVRDKLLKVHTQGGDARLYDAMAGKGATYLDYAKGESPTAFLQQHGLDPKDVGKLTTYMNAFVRPHEYDGLLPGFQSAQNLFKALTYPIWPASHVRNEGSIQYNHLIHGGTGLGQSDAMKLMRQQPIDPSAYELVKHLPPAEAAAKLNELAYAHGTIYNGINSATERVGGKGLQHVNTASGDIGRLTPPVPGSGYVGSTGSVLGDTGAMLKEGVAGMFRRDAAGKLSGAKPWEVAGVGDRTVDKFAPLVAGRKVGSAIEDHGRLSLFLSGLQKGMTPEQAGELVKKAHFDYSDLTAWESNVARKIVPFYTFARKNLPQQADLLMHRPSAIAPTLRAITGQSSQGYVPDHLAGGAAIPLGQVQDEHGKPYDRFLASLGLPVEEGLERFKFKNYDVGGGHNVTLPSLGGTLLAHLGTLSPYLKGPLEYATNTQFMSGRKLDDLYQPTIWNAYGQIGGGLGQALNQIGSNSPLTRVGSTVNKIADYKRKGPLGLAANLLTGVRITDVDTEKAQAIEAAEAMREKLRTDPRVSQFTRFYVNAANRAKVDPQLADQLGLMQAMTDNARKAAEARRAQAPAH